MEAGKIETIISLENINISAYMNLGQLINIVDSIFISKLNQIAWNDMIIKCEKITKLEIKDNDIKLSILMQVLLDNDKEDITTEELANKILHAHLGVE